MIAIMLKIKSILFSIRLNVSTQKLYGLWIIDLVTGGSLLNILNGAPIIKTKSRNGNDSIKIKIFVLNIWFIFRKTNYSMIIFK